MKDNIKPEHYRTGEIDLYEAFSQIFPHNEYRAGMQMIAMRYMFRDKIDRVEDISKAIYTLERLKEKEIEQDKQNSKTIKEAFDDMREVFGVVKTKTAGQYLEDVYRYHDDLLKRLRNEDYEYLARDENGDLWAFRVKPKKEDDFWDTENDYHSTIVKDDNFPQVQWTDNEPTKISELLATHENGGENGKIEQEPRYYAKIKGWEHIGTSSYYFGYDEDNDSLEVTYLESDYRFAFSLTKKHWNKLGINGTNADFEEVE